MRAMRPSPTHRAAATAYRPRAVSASSTARPDDSTQMLAPHADPPFGAPTRYPTTRLPSTAAEPDASQQPERRPDLLAGRRRVLGPRRQQRLGLPVPPRAGAANHYRRPLQVLGGEGHDLGSGHLSHRRCRVGSNGGLIWPEWRWRWPGPEVRGAIRAILNAPT